MPREDGRSPQGQGPRTGRGMGKCGPKSGNSAPQGQGGRRSGKGQGMVVGRGQCKGRGTGQGRDRRS